MCINNKHFSKKQIYVTLSQGICTCHLRKVIPIFHFFRYCNSKVGKNVTKWRTCTTVKLKNISDPVHLHNSIRNICT